MSDKDNSLYEKYKKDYNFFYELGLRAGRIEREVEVAHLITARVEGAHGPFTQDVPSSETRKALLSLASDVLAGKVPNA